MRLLQDHRWWTIAYEVIVKTDMNGENRKYEMNKTQIDKNYWMSNANLKT